MAQIRSLESTAQRRSHPSGPGGWAGIWWVLVCLGLLGDALGLPIDRRGPPALCRVMRTAHGSDPLPRVNDTVDSQAFLEPNSEASTVLNHVILILVLFTTAE
jgi:hypothetical protein